VLDEVSAQCARDARQQYIVDGGGKRFADRLDLIERNRIRPCDALGHTGRALESRRESCGISASFAISAVNAPPCPASATACAGSAHIAAPLSISADPALRASFITPAKGRVNAANGSSESTSFPFRAGWNGMAGGPVRCRVGHRHQHAHERDTVGIAVMDACDQRAAPCKMLDQMELPQGPRTIERRCGKLAHERLQLASACVSGQRDALDVVTERETRDAFPVGDAEALHRTLAEPVELEEALAEDAHQPIETDAIGEQQHRADHHQIARPVHPQPCGVDRRDLFAPGNAHRRMFAGRARKGGSKSRGRCPVKLPVLSASR
jgi:hypothetical protein